MADEIRTPIPLDATSSAIATYVGQVIQLLVRTKVIHQDDVRAIATMFSKEQMEKMEPTARAQFEAVNDMLFVTLKTK